MNTFLLFVFCVCHNFLSVSCSLVITCWERTDLFALLYVFFLVLCHICIGCPKSGVELDCIDA